MGIYTDIDKKYHGFSMRENTLDRLKGNYCKIVTKEPNEEKVHAVVGTVKDIDHHDGLLLIDSKHGTYILNTETIIAIKPKTKKGFAE